MATDRMYTFSISDSNLMITMVIKSLEEISPLPKVLYVQMDSCCGLNKNK